MRNISFMLTKEQIKQKTKTVTRRVGWQNLRVGQLLRGVEKGMGLKSGDLGLCTNAPLHASIKGQQVVIKLGKLNYVYKPDGFVYLNGERKKDSNF